jgi:hypothetical protein
MRDLTQKQMRRSSGSKSAWDVLRGRLPRVTPQSLEDDLAAVRSGQGCAVSCLLRSSSPELPRKFRRGWLQLLPAGAIWRPIADSGRSVDLAYSMNLVERARHLPDDLQLKSGGWHKDSGVLGNSGFQVARASLGADWLELAYPRVDQQLITTLFEQGDPERVQASE